ncbi:Pr6Pr family membrane protein [Actinoplanes hulinensis]|uniref:Pr6Pr family membrane protein n=1 Tax=Actinoplanes hulinensis TaxID=1144547 RepID=A0ABS7BDY6_9ACTN|nr:Pr6Pr family membrane protein [Actinoplanes hulinensis]MBW6438608.1 Pr6Pr family membrane protein [Actinoplanes hulinensis]
MKALASPQALWRVLIILVAVAGLYGDHHRVMEYTTQSAVLVIGYYAVALHLMARRTTTEAPAPRLRTAILSWILLDAAMLQILTGGYNPLPGLAHTEAPGDHLGTATTALIANWSFFLLHYVLPLMVLIDWLAFRPYGATRWRDLPIWMLYPLGYSTVTVARGALFPLAEYSAPYRYLDLDRGFPAVGSWILTLSLAYLAGSAMLVAVDHSRAPRIPSAWPPETAPAGTGLEDAWQHTADPDDLWRPSEDQPAPIPEPSIPGAHDPRMSATDPREPATATHGPAETTARSHRPGPRTSEDRNRRERAAAAPSSGWPTTSADSGPAREPAATGWQYSPAEPAAPWVGTPARSPAERRQARVEASAERRQARVEPSAARPQDPVEPSAARPQAPVEPTANPRQAPVEPTVDRRQTPAEPTAKPRQTPVESSADRRGAPAGPGPAWAAPPSGAGPARATEPVEARPSSRRPPQTRRPGDQNDRSRGHAGGDSARPRGYAEVDSPWPHGHRGEGSPWPSVPRGSESVWPGEATDGTAGSRGSKGGTGSYEPSEEPEGVWKPPRRV